jgi:hypothetical protein
VGVDQSQALFVSSRALAAFASVPVSEEAARAAIRSPRTANGAGVACGIVLR